MIVAAFLLVAGVQAQDLSLDEILENHFETINQKKMMEIESMTYTGKMVGMGMEVPFNMVFVRPGKQKLSVDIQGQKMIQCFDGENGWAIEPWVSPNARDFSDMEIKQAKQQADIDGPMFNYEEKGNKVELVGKEDMEGTEVYKIKITMKEGDVVHTYIDAENFVILKTTATINMQGTDVTSETYFSNYKPVEGVILAFSMETRIGGQVGQSIVFEDVKFNEEYNNDYFARPAAQ